MSGAELPPDPRIPNSPRRSAWPLLLADLRVTARSRFGAGNFPEVTEILASADPTRAGIQEAIDRVRNLRAPDDVDTESARDYAATVAACADDFQQQLAAAIADVSTARASQAAAVDDSPLVIRAQAGAGIGCLLVIAVLPAAAGVIALASGFLLAGLILLGSGIAVGALSIGYLIRARVTLRDGILTKVGLIRTVGWCSVDALGSIHLYKTRWYWTDSGPMEAEGYAFRLPEGRTIFRLSTYWWSPQEIARLAQRVGIGIDGAWSPGRRRRLASRRQAHGALLLDELHAVAAEGGDAAAEQHRLTLRDTDEGVALAKAEAALDAEQKRALLFGAIFYAGVGVSLLLAVLTLYSWRRLAWWMVAILAAAFIVVTSSVAWFAHDAFRRETELRRSGPGAADARDK